MDIKFHAHCASYSYRNVWRWKRTADNVFYGYLETAGELTNSNIKQNSLRNL